MKITILAVGKNRTNLFEVAITEYTKRLSRYTKLEFRYVQASTPETESQSITSQISKYDLVILLDERGSQWSSTELADRLESWQNDSKKSIVFIVGGAHGVTQRLKEQTDEIWSLTNLVLPHEFVRVLLIEQLYRSFNIINGGKYHHS